ncbi:MAG: cysteine hydrolase, partial [Chloroflexi bacterium]|nr:cysteine hydrolase [Chloroflexota bacterium]
EQRSVSKHIYYCLEGSWGFDWYGVGPLPGEAIVTKHRYSAFIGTDLDLILRAQKIETIICTGVVTNACVESTARDGFMMDYHVVFVDDSSATSSPETHEGTLQNIRGGFGVVVNAADVTEAWVPAPVPAMA